MDIHLHIERLVLDGTPFEGGDPAPFRESLEARLQALLTESAPTLGTLSSVHLATLPGPPLATERPVAPQELGSFVGDSLVRGLGTL
jgi:hypothetical protein